MPENRGYDCELDNVNNETSNVKDRKNSDSWRNYNTILPNDQHHDSRSDNWFSKFSKEQCGCGDHIIVTVIGAVIKLGLIWVILYCLFRGEAKYDGGLFKILALTLTSYVVGQIVSIIHLPPLLGMLITGIAFRTSGFYHISGAYPEIVIVLRETALCVILIRAGLGLDAGALLKLSLVVLRLALLPCMGEALAVGVASHFIFGFPWLWGILLGFLLSAVSPAVVVPTLLSLKERGYGQDKGIATLVIGASSLDDITAISVFGICLGIIFSKGALSDQILQGPKELLLGVVSGILWGLLSSFFPNVNESMLVLKRSVMVGGWGLLAVLGSQEIGCPGAGPLSCIIASLTAGIFWKLQGWSNHNPVSEVFGFIWCIFQPILFGLIGAEIDLTQLRLDTIANGVAVILCGLCCRVMTCFVAILGTELNIKEKLFVNLAWIPKATVQAALASKALDTVHEQTSPQEIEIQYGTQILTIAVLSILITAPLGAIGVSVGGPLLLSKEQASKITKNEQEP